MFLGVALRPVPKDQRYNIVSFCVTNLGRSWSPRPTRINAPRRIACVVCVFIFLYLRYLARAWRHSAWRRRVPTIRLRPWRPLYRRPASEPSSWKELPTMSSATRGWPRPCLRKSTLGAPARVFDRSVKCSPTSSARTMRRPGLGDRAAQRPGFQSHRRSFQRQVQGGASIERFVCAPSRCRAGAE